MRSTRSHCSRVLYRVLGDDTGIEVRGYGCGGSIESVGTHALSEVLDVLPRGARDDYLREVSRDERLGSRTRGTAIEKLADLDATVDVRDLALELAARGDPVFVAHVKEALRGSSPEWLDTRTYPNALDVETEPLVRSALGRRSTH